MNQPTQQTKQQATGARAQRILQHLQHLQPLHIELIDDSHLHSRGQESHFRLLIVSPCFKALKPVQRQQQVLKALADEFKAGLHSLSQKALSPEEWQKASSTLSSASKCFQSST